MYGKTHHSEWEKDWLEGNLSGEEVVEKMGKTDEIVALIKSGEQAARFSVPEKRSKEEIWSILVDKVNQEPETKVIPLHRRTWIGIAASIVLLAGAFFLYQALDVVTYKTSFGETASFRLPDNSTVTLNAGSALSFSKRKWKNERSLSMDGEAFFEVQHGSKFTVNTDLGKVEVLGTSFDVKAYDDEMIVACKTGKVRVTGVAEDSEIITPGFRVRALENGEVEEPQEVSLEEIDSWISGEIAFISASMDEVIEELERQFDIKVELKDVETESIRYNGSLYRDNLDNTMKEFSLTYKHLEYEIKDKKVTISAKQ